MECLRIFLGHIGSQSQSIMINHMTLFCHDTRYILDSYHFNCFAIINYLLDCSSQCSTTDKFKLCIRSTEEFYDDKSFTPTKPVSPDGKIMGSIQTTILGTKKCFRLAVCGNRITIDRLIISSRIPLPYRPTFELLFFECTDFTKMTRHGQNSTCIVRSSDKDAFHLGTVIFLPPCASFMYYLQWNEHCYMDLPDFVFWNEDTPSDLMLKAFTLKKIEIKDKADITFVQLVMGPAPHLSYVCHFNHFDGALELLPNGPTNLIPLGMWKSYTVIDFISNARAQYKLVSKFFLHILDHQRLEILKKLPSSSHIFKSFRKRTQTSANDKFVNGKKIRNNLQMLHVQIQILSSLGTCDKNRFYFAIPFLGTMMGKFANVSLSVLN